MTRKESFRTVADAVLPSDHRRDTFERAFVADDFTRMEVMLGTMIDRAPVSETRKEELRLMLRNPQDALDNLAREDLAS